MEESLHYSGTLFVTLLTAYRKLLKISGFTDRLTTLYNSIEDAESKTTTEKAEFLQSESISFDNVSIYTPGDQLLAKHLTFTVEHVTLKY